MHTRPNQEGEEVVLFYRVVNDKHTQGHTLMISLFPSLSLSLSVLHV